MRDEKEFLTVSSLDFTIYPNKISSQDVSVYIQMGDSGNLYHPSSIFKYLEEDRKLTLFKSEKSLQKAPYYNSFHNLDMYFEALTWYVDDPLMHFGKLMGSTNDKVTFESNE